MTKMSVDQPFSHALSPVKTLWFEFLLDPSLLQRHLSDPYADPSAIELIILFLNNAAVLSSSTGSIPVLDDLLPPNGVSNSIAAGPLSGPGQQQLLQQQLQQPQNPLISTLQPEARLDSNSNGSSGSNSSFNLANKKCLGLKLLAIKVAAHLDFNLTIIENQLPINMQFVLLNELIKICDLHNGNKCSLFAYINYYRWILRSVVRLSYPSRKGQNVPIPLLQQIG